MEFEPPAVRFLQGNLALSLEVNNPQQGVDIILRQSFPLDPAQQAAIAHTEGPLLVVAGPGSGKTTVITHRAAHLTTAMQIAPSSLLIVTFTKAAADSLKGRTAALTGAPVASRITFGTFHALAYRMLRDCNPDQPLKLIDEEEQVRLIRSLMRQHGLNLDDDAVTDALAELSRARNRLGGSAAFAPRGMKEADFRLLAGAYEEEKERRGALDFDDLLIRALDLLRSRPQELEEYRRRWRYLMVDEFQDTNEVQFEIVRLLAEPRRNLCVVGDDDQAIYGWRGASPRFLLAFPSLYPECRTVTLNVNYRCPSPVVLASNRLISCNSERFGKSIRPAERRGGQVELQAPSDSLQEAERMVKLVRDARRPLSDWAVIYRTNQQAHSIAQALATADIPFRALGGLPNLYRRWPVQDVLCYLRLASGVGTVEDLEKVINRPNRYVSRKVLAEAQLVADTGKNGLDVLHAIGQTGLLKGWQLRPLEELADHLRRLSEMAAPDAIGYVRTVIGYDDYLVEYAERAGGTPDEMLTVLGEVQRTAPALLPAAFLAEVQSFGDRTLQASSTRGHDGLDEVTLVTCHKAKGLEFPCVVVAGAVAGLMPHRSSDDQEEERRLFYVAMTRAKERLVLSVPRVCEGREAEPSPFLAEALGTEALVRLAPGAPPSAPAPASETLVRAVPKAQPRQRKRRAERFADTVSAWSAWAADLPSLAPGLEVEHGRHGRGTVESVDYERQRVTVNFGGERLSLDLAWCMSTPQKFRVLTGD